MENKTLFTAKLEELLASGCTWSQCMDTLQDLYPELNRSCIKARVYQYTKKHNMRFRPGRTPKRPNNITGSECEIENFDPTKPITKSVEYRSDGSAIFDRIIALSAGEQLTPDKILKAHGMDPEVWEVLNCKSNFYQQQKKGGAILNLYQSKITAKPITKNISVEEIKQRFADFRPNFAPIRKLNKKTGKYMYEINLADLHLGKFACGLETGEFLSTEIAKRRFYEVINAECDNIEKLGDNVEKILFVWTNDFFNSDGMTNTTTGGTPQDTDMKWHELYKTGLEMLISAIDILSSYAPVKTFYIASNHSRETDFHAICTLAAWFKDDKNVEVDTNAHPRHYERYGVNLIGFAHSYYEKKQNLPHLMSVESPKEWGETKYREYHLAHYHCEQVMEKGGIIFRWLPSITGTDSWSNDCGYIGAVKRSYSFVYDKDKGLVQINSTIVD